MSAMSLAFLLAAGTATAVGAVALFAVRGLRRQIEELRAALVAPATLAASGGAVRREGAESGRGLATVPAARIAPSAEIRAAVADALADERERELAEARAFWAAHEARDAVADGYPLSGGPAGPGDEALDGSVSFLIPRQADLAGVEPLLDPDVLGAGAPDPAREVVSGAESDAAGSADVTGSGSGAELARGRAADAEGKPGAGERAEAAADASGADIRAKAKAVESPELTAARRRHPSHPDFRPRAAVGDHDRTVNRLIELAEDRVPLAEVRPGPLGTVDVYVFADGTTLGMTPGHRETAEQLVAALSAGTAPVLVGSSGVSGAYALTFGYAGRCVYVLADRLITSL